MEKTTIRNYRTQDPLHFDHDKTYINGGIQLYIDYFKEKQEAETYALKTISHLLYNMEVANIYDPEMYTLFEAYYRTSQDTKYVARHCFGAVWAYYKSNCGSQFGLDYWEAKLEEKVEDIHCQEVHELMVAFRHNRKLPRSHFSKLMDTNYKKVLLDKWQAEVVYNQKLLIELMVEMHLMKWYDEEVWTKLVTSYIQKKKINNTHYFRTFHRTISEINENEKTGLQGKFTEQLNELVKRHYTTDREWRYDLEKRDWRSMDDLVARRDDCKLED